MSIIDKVKVGSTTYDIQDTATKAAVAELKSAYDSITDTVQSYNIFHANSVTDGKYYNPSNGNYGNNASYSAIDDYIEIEPQTDYIFTYKLNSAFNGRGYFNPILYCYYDSNKTFVSGGQTLTNGIINAPAGVKYLRVSFETAYMDDDLMINKGSTIIQYVPNETYVMPKERKNVELIYDGVSNLREFLDLIPASIDVQYNVYIPEGTYDTLSWFTSDEKSASGFVGFFVPDYITLIGLGSRENVVFSASYDTQNQNVSVINLAGTSGLKNITVIGTRTRYGVHDDFAYKFHTTDRYTRIVENCHFVSAQCTYQSAYGSGYKNGCTAIFKNCIFESAQANCFGWHSNTYDGTIAGDFTYENCKFISSEVPQMHFGGMASGLKHHIHLIGCELLALEMREEIANSGTGLDFEIDGYGNQQNIIENVTVTDGGNYYTKFSDQVVCGMCAGTVARGDLVYRSGVWFAKVSNNPSLASIYGVALEDATNATQIHIKVAGVIPASLLGLTSVSVNNKIGYVNGAATVVTSSEWFAKAISSTHVQLCI